MDARAECPIGLSCGWCSTEAVRTGGDHDLRVAAAIGLGLFVVGAALTWATDSVLIGAILMVAGSSGLFALVLLSATRDASGRDGNLEGLEPVEDEDERLPARWPRR